MLCSGGRRHGACTFPDSARGQCLRRGVGRMRVRHVRSGLHPAEGGRHKAPRFAVLVAECPPLERPFPPSRLPCWGLRLGLGGSGGRGRQGGRFATESGRGGAQFIPGGACAAPQRWGVASLTEAGEQVRAVSPALGNGDTRQRLRSVGVRTPEPPKRRSGGKRQ